MVEQHVRKSVGFLKTTALGGVIFLLPLIVIGALIGQIVPIVMTVAEVLHEFLPFRTPQGIALLVAIAIGIVLGACFFAGIVARHKLGRWFTVTVEKYLLMAFPRYAIFKEQMSGSIGGDEHKPTLRPILVQFDDLARMAFEVERCADGLVTVYLPGSPDPWSGTVAHVKVGQVTPVAAEFGDAVAVFEQLGRPAATLLAKVERERADAAEG